MEQTLLVVWKEDVGDVSREGKEGTTGMSDQGKTSGLEEGE